MSANFNQLLQNNQLKITPARLAVLNSLESTNKPVDIAYIVDKVNQGEFGCDQATVYRTIVTLVKKGLVKQIDFREGKYRYEIEGEHHHHLVCKNCGKVEPIYEKCLAISESDIATKYNFTVNEHHLEFFGLCQNCS